MDMSSLIRKTVEKSFSKQIAERRLNNALSSCRSLEERRELLNSLYPKLDPVSKAMCKTHPDRISYILIY